MSYLSKDAGVQAVQLKVQEVAVKISDPIVLVSAQDITVDVKQDVEEVRAVLFDDDSAGLSRRPQSAITIVSDQQIKVALGAVPADEDCVIIKYVVAE